MKIFQSVYLCRQETSVCQDEPHTTSLQPAARDHIRKSCMYYNNFTIIWAVRVYHVLLFSHVLPAIQPTITCVALCQKKKVWRPMSYCTEPEISLARLVTQGNVANMSRFLRNLFNWGCSPRGYIGRGTKLTTQVTLVPAVMYGGDGVRRTVSLGPYLTTLPKRFSVRL